MMGTGKDSIIKIEDIVFEYAAEDGAVKALDHVSLEIARGSFTSIIGRNGSGKSTLAKHINALLTPSEGCVIVGGYDTREDEYIWEIRRMAGMVFQNPDNQLVSAVVEDDVAFGPENLGLPREEILERVRISLESVAMTEHRKMAPHLLSGGQKQRVAIAGVVAMKPDIIIFDEPTAMLDPEGRGETLEIASRLHQEGVTVLLITHFMEETVHSDRVIIMDRGRICMDGSPQEVFARADEIRGFGLKLPFAVELAEDLRVRGALPVGEAILTEDALAAEIISRHSRGVINPARCETGIPSGLLCEALRDELEKGGASMSTSRKPSGVARFAPQEPDGGRCGAEDLNGTMRSGDGKSKSPKGHVDGAELIIVAEHLTHTYNKGLAYETNALDDVSFEIAAGAYVAIIGHTGSGKSTLIQHLNGLLRPTAGTISVGGIDITARKNASVIEMRKKIGMVFQYPEHQLFEETVYLDVAFGPKNLGVSQEEADERVKEAMALVNMDFNEYAYRSPFELSGGQKRMIAIAGALAMRPEVLVFDEPTAGLDPKSHEEILMLIDRIRDKTGCTIVIVSHNMDDVARLADRVFVMAGGKIIKSGNPAEVYADEAYLKKIGLGVPRAASFAGRLVRGGIEMPPSVLSKQDLLEALSG